MTNHLLFQDGAGGTLCLSIVAICMYWTLRRPFLRTFSDAGQSASATIDASLGGALALFSTLRGNSVSLHSVGYERDL